MEHHKPTSGVGSVRVVIPNLTKRSIIVLSKERGAVWIRLGVGTDDPVTLEDCDKVLESLQGISVMLGSSVFLREVSARIDEVGSMVKAGLSDVRQESQPPGDEPVSIAGPLGVGVDFIEQALMIMASIGKTLDTFRHTDFYEGVKGVTLADQLLDDILLMSRKVWASGRELAAGQIEDIKQIVFWSDETAKRIGFLPEPVLFPPRCGEIVGADFVHKVYSLKTGKLPVVAVWTTIPEALDDLAALCFRDAERTVRPEQDKPIVEPPAPPWKPNRLPKPLTLSDRSMLFVSETYGAIWLRLPLLDPKIFSPTQIAEMTAPVTPRDITSISLGGFRPESFLQHMSADVVAIMFTNSVFGRLRQNTVELAPEVIDTFLRLSLKLWTTCEQMALRKDGVTGVKEFIFQVGSGPTGVQTSYSLESRISPQVRRENLLARADYLTGEVYPEGRQEVTIAVWNKIPIALWSQISTEFML
jgi:hypothetical protein